MRKSGFLLLLAILIILLVSFMRPANPCQEPITYRLGKVDERFNLSREEFRTAVKIATAMWGKPFSRDFFREEADGAIEINLLYDSVPGHLKYSILFASLQVQ